MADDGPGHPPRPVRATANRPRCDALILPSALEGMRLDSVLTGVSSPDSETLGETYWCELEAEHVDAHLALGQTDGGQNDWWLSWTTGIARREPCPEPGFEPEARCRLPLGHAGGHSFELAGLPGQLDSTHGVAGDFPFPQQGQ